MLSDVGAELSFQLPLTASAQFPELFARLEADSERLGIETYGISVTTLEEVFMKVRPAHLPRRWAPAQPAPFSCRGVYDTAVCLCTSRSSHGSRRLCMSSCVSNISSASCVFLVSRIAARCVSRIVARWCELAFQVAEIGSAEEQRKQRQLSRQLSHVRQTSQESAEPAKQPLMEDYRRSVAEDGHAIFIVRHRVVQQSAACRCADVRSAQFLQAHEPLTGNLFERAYVPYLSPYSQSCVIGGSLCPCVQLTRTDSCWLFSVSQTHFRALFRKRLRYALRDRKAVCFQLVIPIIALLLGLILLKTAPIHVPPERVLSAAPYNDFGSSRLTLDLPYWSANADAGDGAFPSTGVLCDPLVCA